jgi:C-terminal processing protease CtpA/Prc
MGANGDVSAPPGFHMPFFGSSLNVGALVEPLTAQMAEALGVNGGLMVKTVARKTEAAKAGLRALDVILKVGSDPINTAADWERALRSNVGKQVQVTILRDKKQQTVSLQVDSKRHSELELFEIFGDANPELVAENDFVFPEALEAQAEQFSGDQFKVDPEDMQELQQQMEQFKKDFNADRFKQQFQMDQKQKDQLRQQMEQFKKSFNADQFKVDPKQMQEMQHQMDQWKQQMQDQMEYLREQQSGHFV